VIEVKNLTKCYGGRCAVDHLNFTLADGQIYGFLGPNGAGKSTTMNMITGYLAPTEGEVRINGINISDDPEKARRSIGYLPELPPLYKEMTVGEYLTFAAELKKIPAAERESQLRRAAALTHVEDVWPRLIKNLSKGYCQRVGLAQAILGFPPVLIFDEPTVGLDPKQIAEIRELIRTLSGQHTVILSSHILPEVQAVCDRLLIIHRGRLLADDTPAHLEASQGGQTLRFTVRGAAGTVQNILTATEGVTHYHLTQNGDLTEAQAEVEENSDPREAIFYALADARCPLLTMLRSENTLEQVFLKMTGDEKEEGAAR